MKKSETYLDMTYKIWIWRLTNIRPQPDNNKQYFFFSFLFLSLVLFFFSLPIHECSGRGERVPKRYFARAATPSSSSSQASVLSCFVPCSFCSYHVVG